MHIKDGQQVRRWVQMAALGLGLIHTGHAWAARWNAVGPYGGDARSLAAEPGNPRHLYMGTTSSWIYQTADGGSSWQRLAKLGTGDNLVVDNILVDTADSKTVLAGAFQVDERGGGIFFSHDGGQHWAENKDMAGQSVRALAQATSNAKVWVAGTVEGVFRSQDGGEHWTKISPAGSNELHEVESVAIDPTDPNTMYAGTWHLPWKTTDGGQHWANVKEGLIDDSDVFSIIIDPGAPSIIYASACSGIYKSENGGGLFHKVQGIPSTARRTRVLMQDPAERKIVYAGTTEGLYKTADGGTAWTRLTGPDVIINDVYVDPKNDQHLLLATDRSGVLESEDGGKTFQGSNTGFSQRLVQTLLLDNKAPATIYAGVLNDKIYGGVFVSEDGGTNWKQRADGLEGRDVFTLAQAEDGTVLAGTAHGIFRWSGTSWAPDNDTITRTEKQVRVRTAGKRPAKAPGHRTRTEIATREQIGKGTPVDGRVNALSLAGPAWYAATSGGVYRSEDLGKSWEMAAVAPGDYQFVNAHDAVVIASRRDGLMVSEDAGKAWKQVPLPEKLTGIRALVVSANHTLWVGGREGLFYSEDLGGSWKQIEKLPLGEISGLNYDADLKRVLVTSRSSTMIFGVDGTDSQWKWWDAGWKVHEVHSKNGRLVGASLFDGVVVEPEAAAGTPVGGAQ